VKTTIRKNDKIHVITLGCSKNLVDSEKLMRQLSEHNIAIEHDKDQSDARTVIINTCGFINDAKQESIDTILNHIKAKQQGLIDHVYVMGCLSERYADALKNEIPEVDKYFGVNNIKDIIESLGYNFKDNLIGERLVSTPSHYAYLKISEGCNRKCAFCAIPLIRGPYQSQSIKDLVHESKSLANKGVKELILIAQDLSYYGKDIDNTYQLPSLINQISEISGIEWIRLHYAYPLGFPKEIAHIMLNNPKVCKYLDIPFQHISDNMLKTMRRGLNKEKTIKLIESLRKEVPDLALRTTLLVGHPGEKEKDFEELVEFVKATRFERLGVFTYSHEEDTLAYKKMKDSIPAKVKMERADYIMKVQQGISEELNVAKIGKTYKVLIDGMEGDNYIGRTEYDSPEVDNEVIIKSAKKLKTGSFYNVKITEASEFDLSGEVI
jgi:ribosomal protein S12 methylthiotransferase